MAKDKEDLKIPEIKKDGTPDKRIQNKFWTMRSKHGREKIFENPEIMKEAADEYFVYESKQVFNKPTMITTGPKAGTVIQVGTPTPFTIQGLTLFLGVGVQYLTDFEEGLERMEDRQKANNFSLVITYIKSIITKQKVDGATTGTYNPLIVSRLEGLRDNVNTEHSGKVTHEVHETLFMVDKEDTESEEEER